MATSMRPGRWTVAIAAFALMAGCGSGRETAPQRAAAETPGERLDLGVVAITASIGGDRVESSGVVIDGERGLILTTAHGVWGARSLKVGTGIAVLHGRIVARDACDDLALLETQPRLPGLVAVRPTDNPVLPSGGMVVAASRRRGLPSRVSAELDTHRVVLRSGPAAPLLPGVRPKGAVPLQARELPPVASGAPLLGTDGRLAGLAQVVVRGRRTIRTALPWSTISARLGELQPGDQAQYVGWRRHYRCSAALHRYTAARHRRFRPDDAQLNAPVPATRLRGTEDVDG